MPKEYACLRTAEHFAERNIAAGKRWNEDIYPCTLGIIQAVANDKRTSPSAKVAEINALFAWLDERMTQDKLQMK